MVNCHFLVCVSLVILLTYFCDIATEVIIATEVATTLRQSTLLYLLVKLNFATCDKGCVGNTRPTQPSIFSQGSGGAMRRATDTAGPPSLAVAAAHQNYLAVHNGLECTLQSLIAKLPLPPPCPFQAVKSQKHTGPQY